MNKKLYIKTYGCQMNVYDSLRMEDVLAPMGYDTTDSYEEADLVLLNTCHIREKAAEKVYSELGRIRQSKDQRAKAGKQTLIGVAGCVAQAEGEEIMRRAPYVDMVIGSQSYHLLPDMIKRAEHKYSRHPEQPKAVEGSGTEETDSSIRADALTQNDGEKIIELAFPEIQKFDYLPEQTRGQGATAFVSVQEGCDKFCSFCVVPYTRGEEYSRPVMKVIDEVKQQMDHGAIEITLLGQNVNAYHGEGPDGREWSLGRLIMELAKLDGLERIRYTTSHPRDMHEELYQAHAQVEKLMPYLHLPIQAGSNKVLKAMNRKHTADEYIAIIEKLRSLRPDMAFSGDFIVGFPGESEADFESTLRVVETVGYTQAYSFKYSPRPGTPAANADQVAEAEKVERLERLQALLNKQQYQFNQQTVGKLLPVLFEKRGRHAGQWIGRSPYMQAVHMNSEEDLQNQFLLVEVTEAHPNSLRADISAQYRPAGEPVITEQAYG